MDIKLNDLEEQIFLIIKKVEKQIDLHYGESVNFNFFFLQILVYISLFFITNIYLFYFIVFFLSILIIRNIAELTHELSHDIKPTSKSWIRYLILFFCGLDAKFFKELAHDEHHKELGLKKEEMPVEKWAKLYGVLSKDNKKSILFILTVSLLCFLPPFLRIIKLFGFKLKYLSYLIPSIIYIIPGLFFGLNFWHSFLISCFILGLGITPLYSIFNAPHWREEQQNFWIEQTKDNQNIKKWYLLSHLHTTDIKGKCIDFIIPGISYHRAHHFFPKLKIIYLKKATILLKKEFKKANIYWPEKNTFNGILNWYIFLLKKK